MGYKEKYEEWLTSPAFDEGTKEELRGIAGNEKEIEDRFYRNLKFGTGGLRGMIGAGTNRMNEYTVTLATQGLANYIKSLGPERMSQGVAIAYDSRRMSPEFSEAAALCLNANGIKTYRFDSLRPTPELSFAVRELGCVAGIVITASHNPPEYNGYKVYWEDGAQITPPHDKNILAHVAEVTDYAEIQMMPPEDARAAGLYNGIPAETDEHYYESLMQQLIHTDVIASVAEKIKIVYTPLHGTGNVPVQEVLCRMGFTKVFVVPEQEQPDGDFPTVKSPNPENKEAFMLALELARKVDADIVLATDPDADRLGAYIKDTNGVFEGTHLADTPEYPYVCFTGNMTGVLLEEYICREKKSKGELPSNGVICSTVVSTNLGRVIAEAYDMQYVETLTGFKYIGEQMRLFDEEGGKRRFIYGLEESYGCLAGDYTRDKDACSAVVLLCEAAAFYKNNGRTLCDAMNDIYQKYGYYAEGAYSVTMNGAEGAMEMQKVVERMRRNPFGEIAGRKVMAIRDYESDTRTVMKAYTELVNVVSESDGRTIVAAKGIFHPAGEISSIGLPKSNVLYFELDNDAWFAVRPSGTEPKIKCYFGVNESDMKHVEKRLDEMRAFSVKIVSMPVSV